MKDNYLSRFTPSTMEPAALEALLVQSGDLAKQLVDLVAESAMTKSKHHTLLVGPRGIGKTHIVSTIYHRVRQLAITPERLCIAWLREEEWGVSSFLDLLLRILRALVVEYGDSTLKNRLKELYDSPPRVAENIATNLLEEYLAGRTLFLIVENLDELFRGLNEDGQMRLRAHIQEKSSFTILATTPSLFAGVSLQTSPFYGFFRIRHLKGLSFEQAVQLLTGIAKLLGDSQLADFIQSPSGRARARAVHHLAGGNHRVYVVFSQFLTRKSLDDLIEPFFRTLDDLTPYYQSRMLYLSTQQQKIVALLCDHRRPLTVKEISQRCFITQQTTSSQLKSLKHLGYVNSTSVGRESYYELSEPLMRLTIEVKKHRIEPIRLFIDFLRLWYSRKELEARLTTIHPEAKYERQYVMHALETDDGGTENTLIGACIKDCRLHLREGDYKNAMQAAEELVAIRGAADDFYELGHCLGHLGKLQDSLVPLEQSLKLNPQHPKAWGAKAGTLLNLGQFDEALQAYDKAVQLNPDNDLFWGGRGFALYRIGRYEEAITSADEALKLDSKDVRHWACRAMALADLGRYSEATASWNRTIELEPDDPSGYLNRAITLSDAGQFDDAIADLERAVHLGGQGGHAWNIWYNKALILNECGRRNEAIEALKESLRYIPDDSSSYLETGATFSKFHAEGIALELYDKALSHSPNDPHIWLHKAYALSNLGRLQESVAASDKVIELGDRSADAFFHRTNVLIALDDWDAAKLTVDKALEVWRPGEPDLDSERLVYSIFRNMTHHRQWPLIIEELVGIYKKHSLLTYLGQGLVANIRVFIAPQVGNELGELWRAHWLSLGRQNVELRLPAQIMDVAIRYSRDNDVRSLLELPQELRSLLDPLISRSSGARENGNQPS